VCEADDFVAEEAKFKVPDAIVLERLAAAVIEVAVGLDDQRLMAPEEIDLVPTYPGVDVGQRQTVAAAEVQEFVLELAADGDGLNSIAEERPRTSASRIARRSWWAGTLLRRSAIVRSGVVTGIPLRRVEAEITEGDRCRRMPWRFLRPAEAGIVTSTVPEGGGAAVAEDRAVPAGEDGRHPAGLVAQCSVTYGVDAAVDAVEAAAAGPVENLALAQSRSFQLRH
jgi:hypothetical protein